MRFGADHIDNYWVISCSFWSCKRIQFVTQPEDKTVASTHEYDFLTCTILYLILLGSLGVVRCHRHSFCPPNIDPVELPEMWTSRKVRRKEDCISIPSIFTFSRLNRNSGSKTIPWPWAKHPRYHFMLFHEKKIFEHVIR